MQKYLFRRSDRGAHARLLAVVVATAATAACGGPTSPTGADASPGAADARPDALMLTCGAASGKPEGATGTIASGVYDLVWSPVSGPLGNVNPLLGTNRLTLDVAAGTARFDSTTCAECVGDHTGRLADGCLMIDAGHDGTPSHDAYLMCATIDRVVADITWCGYPGPPDARRWRMTGTLH